MAKTKLFSPVYFETLGEINFDNFDTPKALVLMYLFVHCKSGDFFVTLNKFKQVLGLNKALISRITGQLKAEGVIDFETRGHSNTTHYSVDYKKMATKTFLERFFKTKELAASYQPYFQEIARQTAQKQVSKTRGKTELSSVMLATIEQIRREFEDIYNDARTRAPVEGTFKGFGPQRANLPFDKVHKQKVSRLMTKHNYTYDSMVKAFRAFISEHYSKSERERNQVSKPVSYFLMEKDGGFPVFVSYLNYYNERYARRGE